MMKFLPKYSSGPYITITLVTKVMHFIYFFSLGKYSKIFSPPLDLTWFKNQTYTLPLDLLKIKLLS